MIERAATSTSEHAQKTESTSESLPTKGSMLARLRNRLVMGAVIASLLLLSLVAINSESFSSLFSDSKDDSSISSSDNVRRLPVRVQPAQFVDKISQQRKYTGVVRSQQQANLGFELTGRVEQVLVDEGDIVDNGQIIAYLDVKSLEARKASTNASLAQAKAVLSELNAGPRQQTIDAMRAQWQEANSNLKLAAINFERRKRLRSDGAISDSEFDEAQYAQHSAQSKLDSIANQLDELETGTRHERIAAQTAAVKQLESLVDEIKVQIEKSAIVAPFSGKIVQRMADPGGIATASMPILKIVDVKNLEAVIGIPVETAAPMNLESEFEILVAGEKYKSTLKAKIQQLDLATRTQNLIFKLNASANEKVISGQLCQIEVSTDVEGNGFWVPASSLTNGIRGLWSLMVVDEETSKAMRTDVQLIYTDGDRVLVDGPLKNCAMVVVEGAHRIVSGQHVQAVTE